MRATSTVSAPSHVCGCRRFVTGRSAIERLQRQRKNNRPPRTRARDSCQSRTDASDARHGVTPVEVDLDDFSFTYDTAAIAEAEQLAFRADNVGEQEHEISLARIPADADIDELLMSEAEPEGVEFLGGATAEPGDSANLVFVEPLGPGRYVMVCFLPDTSEGEDGQPHALLGMVSEFTIE